MRFLDESNKDSLMEMRIMKYYWGRRKGKSRWAKQTNEAVKYYRSQTKIWVEDYL